MKKKTIIYLILALVIISNIPPVQYFIEKGYCYRNTEGSFTYCEFPEKGITYKSMRIQYQQYLLENPDKSNQTLYRTFRIKPWQFWEWWQFIAHHQRFTLPYFGPEKAG